MAADSSEETPLISPIKESSLSLPANNTNANANANANLASAMHLKSAALIFGNFLAFQSVLDWSPFFVVQSMIGFYSPAITFRAGALAAASAIIHSYSKHIQALRSNPNEEEGGGTGINADIEKNKGSDGTVTESASTGTIATVEDTPFQAKLLDMGQLILFGALYLLTILLQLVWSNAGMYLLLWFNPITTGGMGCIMTITVIRGRPFVYDYVKPTMPPQVWNRLMSKRWYQNALMEAATFWIKLLTVMTVIVTIQPLLVTLYYDGNAENDYSGWMTFLRFWLTVGQFVILFYAFYVTFKMQTRQRRVRRRVRERIKNGLTEKEQKLYGDAVDIQMKNNHRILSLAHNQEEDLKESAMILADAFQKDEVFQGCIDTEEERLNYFRANLKALVDFHHVLVCKSLGGQDIENGKPKCVMACVPVFSKSKEELEVFHTISAWVEYGWELPSFTETDFPLPEDDTVELAQMKFRSSNGLKKQSYIYIAYFGADPNYRGMGYGRTLLNYAIGVSEEKQMPLVLETSTELNRVHYEQYGFHVVDQVKGRPDWVLMVRPVLGHQRHSDAVLKV